MPETMIERVARAIESVKLISRYNDWTSDRVEGLPIEVLIDDPEGVAGEGAIVARFAGPKSDCSARREEVLRVLRAKAAIEAMREPTEPMLAAVKPEPTHLYSSRSEDYQKQMKGAVAISRLGFESDWRTAIDAALNEQEWEKR